MIYKEMEYSRTASSNTPLCARGCGFFGTAENRNLYSRCYNDHLISDYARFVPTFLHCVPLYDRSHYVTESSRVLKMISWIPPPQGWFKINTDGSWKPSGVATAAGVIRDSDGNWITGFAINLPDCSSALVAELCGILSGLHVAQDYSFRNIIIESDNKIAVDAINEVRETKYMGEPEHSLITCIKELMSVGYNIRLQHQYREGNRVADALATLAYDLPIGELVTLDHPSQNTIILLIEDIRGVKFPRMCPSF